MNHPLFRKEVLEARQGRWLGGISLGQPLSIWMLTGFAVLAAVTIIVFLVIGDYTRRTRVLGQLVPTLGVATVVSPTAGILKEVRVKEGQRVSAGDILAVVSVPQQTLAGGDTSQAVQHTIEQGRIGTSDAYTSQRRQLQAQQTGLADQILNAHGELQQLQAQLATRQQQQALAEATLDSFQDLREKQFVSELQVQQQQATALEQLSAVQDLQRQILTARRQLAQLQQAQRELPSQLAALSAAEGRDLAALERESLETAARSEAVLTAPITGSIATLLGQVGQTLQPGQFVLSLLPASSTLEAQLLVPSRAVGFIEPGDTVLLRYQAYPYQKFGHYQGKVERISHSALNTNELSVLTGNTQTNEPYYRIIVRLDQQSIRAFGQDAALKPGLLLDADILGEQRKLWEWILEPLYSVTGRILQ